VCPREYCRFRRRQHEEQLDKTVAAMNRFQQAAAGKALPYPHDRDVSSK
jgi:hypothetical protein